MPWGQRTSEGSKKVQASSYKVLRSPYCIVLLNVAKSSHHKEKQFLTVRRWMLIKFGALIISQYIPTSDCYVTHLKLIHCCMTITSQLNWFKKTACV